MFNVEQTNLCHKTFASTNEYQQHYKRTMPKPPDYRYNGKECELLNFCALKRMIDTFLQLAIKIDITVVVYASELMASDR